VGVAISLDNASAGTLRFTIANAPAQLDVYASAAPGVPATITDWGAPILEGAAVDEAGRVTSVAVDQPAQHLLIWFRQVPRDDGCSSRNPHRGTIGEISFGT
jgi:hypothetical protein